MALLSHGKWCSLRSATPGYDEREVGDVLRQDIDVTGSIGNLKHAGSMR